MMTETDLAEAKERALLAKLDDVYAQRNRLAALLALAVSALGQWGAKQSNGEPINGGLGRDESQSPEWQTTILIDLPGPNTGQISFHVHEREVTQFRGLHDYRGAWDGHDDAEKWRRVAQCLTNQESLMVEAGFIPALVPTHQPKEG